MAAGDGSSRRAGHRCHGRSEPAGPGWIHQPV